MALNIDTNKDIEKYEASVIAGLNPKQTITAIAALGLAAGTAFLAYYLLHVTLMVAGFIGMFPAIFVFLLCSKNKNGKTLVQMLSAKTRCLMLIYSSTETRNAYHKKEISQKQDKKEMSADEEYAKTMKIVKVIGVIALLVIVGVVVAILGRG